MPEHEAKCPFCGARQMPAWEWKIYKRIASILPAQAPATKLLLLVLVLLFILMCIDIVRQSDFSFMQLILSPPGEILWRWGAHVRGDFSPWRLIMANFVHVGLIHILFNGSALKTVGPMVERYFGSAATLGMFVILGTASMACSNILGSAGIVAGASGGLMGYIGMVAAAGRREKTEAGKKISNAMFLSAAFVMGFGFLVSMSNTMGIDNIAHGSGFILGLLAGYVLPVQGFTGFTRLWPKRLGAVLLLLGIAACTWATMQMLTSSQLGQQHDSCVSAIKENRPSSAVKACAEAYKMEPANYATINNLILAYRMAGQNTDADALCAQAKAGLSVQDFAKIAPELCELP